MRPPGWMLGDGWAVTAEVGGESERRGGGPHRKPSTAWVRSRPGATMLMIGGRNLAAGEGATAQVAVSIAGRVVHTFAARPGFFIERLALPAGSLAGGDAYLPMEVTAVPLGPAPVGVSLEQFDLQPDGVPMIGALEGWQEPEYNPATGRSWRWMSDRASFWVRQVGRDVTLRLSAESPLRYFDGPPALRRHRCRSDDRGALTVSGFHLGGSHSREPPHRRQRSREHRERPVVRGRRRRPAKTGAARLRVRDQLTGFCARQRRELPAGMSATFRAAASTASRPLSTALTGAAGTVISAADS